MPCTRPVRFSIASARSCSPVRSWCWCCRVTMRSRNNRELMGATDPAKAEVGTIRKAHGANIEFNAVHGSDSPETATFEIGYFFPGMDLVG